jgi:hypothetical protein
LHLAGGGRTTTSARRRPSPRRGRRSIRRSTGTRGDWRR